jgi:hypothetical protein
MSIGNFLSSHAMIRSNFRLCDELVVGEKGAPTGPEHRGLQESVHMSPRGYGFFRVPHVNSDIFSTISSVVCIPDSYSAQVVNCEFHDPISTKSRGVQILSTERL